MPGQPGPYGAQPQPGPYGAQPQPGHAGPGQPGYPDHGYPPPDGYGSTVNGGEYAYVINDTAPRPGRPAAPQGPPPTAPEPRRRTREERMQARPTGEIRSITVGRTEAAKAANPPPNANAGSAYGLDDPGYGPPAPGWSHQDRPAGAPAKAEPNMPQPAMPQPSTVERPKVELKTESVTSEPPTPEPLTPQPVALEPDQAPTPAPPVADQQPVRGPFEPLPEHNGQPSGAAGLPAGHSATDEDGRPYEFPGLDHDEPAGSAHAALDRLKELHRTAAAVAPQSLDAHFDQLLERQRRLISEYISESERPPTAAEAGDDSLVGFGGDSRGTR